MPKYFATRVKLAFVTLTLLIVAFPTKSVAAATTSENIDNFSTFITVNKNGSISVNENIDYNFGTAQRHGIIRELPKLITDTQNRKYLLEVKNVSVKDFNFATSNGAITTEIKIGDANKFVTGKISYDIDYDVDRSLRYFNDYDEIYWNVTGNDWEVPITSGGVKITFPTEIVIKPEDIKCYTGVFKSSTSNCEIKLELPNVVVVTLNKPLGVYEGFSVAVAFPKGIVAVSNPIPYQQDSTQIGGKTDFFHQTPFIMFKLALGMVLFVLVFPITIYYLASRDSLNTKKHAKILSAWFEPPKRPDGSLMSPAEVLMLVNKKLDHKAISAELIHLAQKGFIKITVDPKDGAISFLKRQEYRNSGCGLKDFEIDIMDSIFDGGKKSQIAQKDLKNSDNFFREYTSFVNKVSTALYENKMFEKDLEKAALRFSSLMSFAIIVSFFSTNFFFGILLLFVIPLVSRASVKKTMLGIEKYSEAVSLRNFLQSQEDQLNFQAKNQMLFEKLLPYATAFGVEDVWAKRFADLQMNRSDWFEGDLTYSRGYSGTFSLLSLNMGRSLNYSRNYHSEHGFASGSRGGFGGGGFSGGGGGGGGGHSW